MRKRIKARIQKAKIQSEFQIELIPRRHFKQHPDYLQSTKRDVDGNNIDSQGNTILTRIKTDSLKTLTPAEQFRLSAFSPRGQMLRELRRQRQDGSEVGLDKRFEENFK